MKNIFGHWLIGLSRPQKRFVTLLADFLIILVVLWSSFSVRLGQWYVPPQEQLWLFLVAPIIAIPIFIRFGLYRSIIRYIGFKALWAIVQAVSLYSLLWSATVLLGGVSGVPRSVTIINWLMAILIIGGSRMVVRWWAAEDLSIASKNADTESVLIYGAGSAGVQLVNALKASSNMRPVAFIDDEVAIHGRHINGLTVHSFLQIGTLLEKYNVTQVLLALPSTKRSRRLEIIHQLEPYPVHVMTIPGINDITEGKVAIDDIKDVGIEDLLGRDSVQPNKELLDANIRNKVVLVTGAGGSIGSELCRQIIKLQPRILVLYECNEFALYTIQKELINTLSDRAQSMNAAESNSTKAMRQSETSIVVEAGLIPILGNVVDQRRLEEVCKTFLVNTIYHAAAYKHVPLVEKNPIEAINNNINGTLHAAQAAMNTRVETFVLISTDKAVRPANTMGATKRFAELMLQGLAENSSFQRSLETSDAADMGSSLHQNDIFTRFTMVRFGNVLGSSGSVIPLFREQIRKGGPVTVTDPKIIRYFMTIPEAAQLVIQAGAMGQGGDVFVLDMGDPVKILDLAKRMIHLSGLEIKDEGHVDGDISIQFTGLRPGEKLYEELLIGDDVSPTDHALIMRATEEVLPWADVQRFVDGFNAAAKEHDQKKIRALLQEAVPGFKPQCDIEDVVYKAKKSNAKLNNVRQLKQQSYT